MEEWKMKITEERIAELEGKGFKRWTKEVKQLILYRIGGIISKHLPGRYRHG